MFSSIPTDASRLLSKAAPSSPAKFSLTGKLALGCGSLASSFPFWSGFANLGDLLAPINGFVDICNLPTDALSFSNCVGLNVLVVGVLLILLSS